MCIADLEGPVSIVVNLGIVHQSVQPLQTGEAFFKFPLFFWGADLSKTEMNFCHCYCSNGFWKIEACSERFTEPILICIARVGVIVIGTSVFRPPFCVSVKFSI